MNQNFLRLFLFGDTKKLGGGEEVQEKAERETNSAHIHTCKKKGKKKTRDIINI